jgi:hypothetical protein
MEGVVTERAGLGGATHRQYIGVHKEAHTTKSVSDQPIGVFTETDFKDGDTLLF